MEWPPNYKAVFKQRLERLEIIRKSPENLRGALAYYRTHPLEFIEHWAVTFDPRRIPGPKTIPFVQFAKQQQFVLWLDDRFNMREDGIVTKCRDMGVSWDCVHWSMWAWLFKPEVKIGFGSRKEEFVDDIGEPDAIFEKLRIARRWLPIEFLPAGFKESRDDNFMKLENPQTGAIISGEAGDNIGRGGRSSIYFLDEAAHVEHPQRVDAALEDNSDCKIHVSTHNGTGTTFYRKWRGGHYKVFDFKWHDHPGKDIDWYNKEKVKRDPANFAQEVENDPEASLENIVCPGAWVRAARELKLFKPPLGALRIGGMDVGGGSDLSVFVVRHGNLVEKPIAWNDADIINTGTYAAELFHKHKITCLNYDVYGLGTGVMATLKRIPNVRAQGINTGQPPTTAHWPDGKTSKEKFLNLKAELWWTIRDRLHKSYEYVQHLLGNGGHDYPLDELLCLPDDDTLCSQLSAPRWFTTPSGKIQIETKEELSKRGVKSPDHADALALAFAPVRGELRVKEIKGYY